MGLEQPLRAPRFGPGSGAGRYKDPNPTNYPSGTSIAALLGVMPAVMVDGSFGHHVNVEENTAGNGIRIVAEDGWLVRIRIAVAADLEDLLESDDYQDFIEGF